MARPQLLGGSSLMVYFGVVALMLLPVLVTSQVSATQPWSYCDGDYQRKDGRCYKFSTEEASWSDAAASCVQDQATLLTIVSSTENRHIARVLGISTNLSQVWIGYHSDPQGHYSWHGDDTTFNRMQTEDSEHPIGELRCVAYNTQKREPWNKKWTRHICSKLMRYVCEKGINEPPTTVPTTVPTTIPPTTPCTGDYKFNSDSGKCYKTFTTKKTWDEAAATCSEDQASLLTISNPRENRDIATLISIPKGQRSDVWIGYRSNDEGQLLWRNENFNSTLNKLLPVEHPDGELHCAAYVKHSGTEVNKRWQLHACSDVLPFICDKSVIGDTPDAPTTVPSHPPTQQPPQVQTQQPTESIVEESVTSEQSLDSEPTVGSPEAIKGVKATMIAGAAIGAVCVGLVLALAFVTHRRRKERLALFKESFAHSKDAGMIEASPIGGTMPESVEKCDSQHTLKSATSDAAFFLHNSEPTNTSPLADS